jgi:hypothetical protein
VADVPDWWPAVVFGWPAVVLALSAFAGGFLTSRSWLGLLGALISAPFCFYASGYPLFHWIAPIGLCANFVAAWLLHRRRHDIAFAALVPFVMIVTTLAVFAIRNIRLMRW